MLELKFPLAAGVYYTKVTYNRTMLELKLLQFMLKKTMCYLIIVQCLN